MAMIASCSIDGIHVIAPVLASTVTPLVVNKKLLPFSGLINVTEGFK
jgi:hypothetical protein